jgi:3-methyladenine DNA glycosylase AlkD
MPDSLKKLKLALDKLANQDKAAFYPRFFKTGKGEYGEGDRFIGVVVPDQRKVAGRFRDLPLPDIALLLASPYHEHRNTALFILSLRYARAKTDQERTAIFSFTVKHMGRINNWDLVDCAGPKIIGYHMLSHPAETKRLYRWARAKNLWMRRMSIIATFPFIREGNFAHTLEIAESLVADEHDLIHKAVGWMLREVGNRDRATERRFLDAHAATMPRTMLRYAIEKFPEELRQVYLQGRSRASG